METTKRAGTVGSGMREAAALSTLKLPGEAI